MEKIVDEFINDISAILHAEIIVDGWSEEKLRLRESRAFDSKWIEEYRRIKPRDVDHEVKMEIDAIRKAVFLEVFRKTGSSDIAGLASDDFELFVSAKIKSIKSNFTSFLQREYSHGRFPAEYLNQ